MYGNILQTINTLKNFFGGDPDKAVEQLKNSNPQFKEFSEKSLDEIAKEYKIDIDAIKRMIG